MGENDSKPSFFTKFNGDCFWYKRYPLIKRLDTHAEVIFTGLTKIVDTAANNGNGNKHVPMDEKTFNNGSNNREKDTMLNIKTNNEEKENYETHEKEVHLKITTIGPSGNKVSSLKILVFYY